MIADEKPKQSKPNQKKVYVSELFVMKVTYEV